MMYKLCCLLYQIDRVLFEKIALNHTIKRGENGQALICFKDDQEALEIKKSQRKYITKNIFLFTNTETRHKFKAIRQLLAEYHISEISFSVFLRIDERAKYGKKPIGKFLNTENPERENNLSNEEKRDFEKKIGEYARDYFTVYFSNKTNKFDLANFLDKEWCGERFGIGYPLLKEVDPVIPISEQKKYDKVLSRYWIKPIVDINGKSYVICSQWFWYLRDKLDKWIREESSRKQSQYKQAESTSDTKLRSKQNCIHYDFKQDKCLCTENHAVFGQKCNAINSCKYYRQFALHIIPKSFYDSRKCPHCSSELINERIKIEYSPDEDHKQTKTLIVSRCNNCEINYMADTAFNIFTFNKKLEDLNVSFLKETV